MRSHSYENDFDLHEKETACRTHFHMQGFALRLALKQRHKRTRKLPGFQPRSQGFSQDLALGASGLPGFVYQENSVIEVT